MSSITYEPQTCLVEIDTVKLEYQLVGSGEPAVILLNGHNTPMSNWDTLVPLLQGVGTILLYDRAGVGKSDRPKTPQDGLTVITRLHDMIEKLSLTTPVILVGHSLGGLYANLYARVHPTETAGVVLVDSGHPDEAQEREAKLGFFGKLVDRLLSSGKSSFRNDPNSEYNSVPTTVLQIAASPPFPDIPLVVISGTQKMPFMPVNAFNRHLELQDKLAGLSSRSTHIKASKSGHFPHLSESGLVAEAIVGMAQHLKQHFRK